MTVYVVRVMGFDMMDTSTGWVILSIWTTKADADKEETRLPFGVDILPVELDTPHKETPA